MPEQGPSFRARGMRDALPDEMERARAVDAAFARACSAWGYREVRTPLIEHLHLFTSAGTLSPQTLDRVYSFLDWDGWSGERVVLRPDSTIPTARLYAEHLDGVAKLFYSQDVYRFTDDGSSRQEWQCGVELIGPTGPAGDVELVLLALEAMAALGLPRPSVRLSHARLVRAVLAAAGLSAEEQAAAYDRLLDGDMAVVDDVEARLPQLNAPLRLLFEVEGEGSGYIANVRQALAKAIPAVASPLAELAFVVEALEARGVTPLIHTVLARSFEYYSGIVMRFEAEGRRVGVGGRYDELIGLIGGNDVPASGFALSVAPLAELMTRPAATASVHTIAVRPAGESAAAVAAAFEAAQRLRAAGMRAAVIGETADERVACDATGYTLTTAGGDERFSGIEELIVRLERLR